MTGAVGVDAALAPNEKPPNTGVAACADPEESEICDAGLFTAGVMLSPPLSLGTK